MGILDRHTVRRTAVLALVLVCALGTRVSAQQEKDHMKAFLLSFLVPGAGQYYAGSPGYAKLFIAAELAIWGGYYYNVHMKEGRRNDYLNQAALHADVNLSAHGTSYMNAVGTFDSSFEYNHHQVQTESQPRLYTGARHWEWDRTESRLRFRNLREMELEYENNIKFCIAGLLVNHFLAGLNASRLVQNAQQESAVSMQVYPDGLGAVYTRSF